MLIHLYKQDTYLTYYCLLFHVDCIKKLKSNCVEDVKKDGIVIYIKKEKKMVICNVTLLFSTNCYIVSDRVFGERTDLIMH